MRIVLQRAGETISIGTDIRFTILAITGDEVQIGIAKGTSRLPSMSPLHSSSLGIAEPDANFYQDDREDLEDFP